MPDLSPAPAHRLKHTAIVPVSGVHQGVIDALSYGLSIAEDVRAVYVEISPEATANLRKEWAEAAAQVPVVVLKSPFRPVIAPVVDDIDSVKSQMVDDVITVIIPEFVTSRWYHRFLHHQTAIILNFALRGRREVIVASVRYLIG